MSQNESGNWNESPWRLVRNGIEQVTFGMSADMITCTIGRVQNNAEINPHSHPNEQIALVVEGRCDYYVDGTPYKLTPGSWVVVPPDVVHYIHVYESEVPCLQMDIFSPARPEYVKLYKDFLAEQGQSLVNLDK